jgi:hypothetical protein
MAMHMEESYGMNQVDVWWDMESGIGIDSV